MEGAEELLAIPGALRDALGNEIPERGELRVWLDDSLEIESRRAIPGFLHMVTAREVCFLLTTGRVVELSLDHDLGEAKVPDGEDEDPCGPDPFKDQRFGKGSQVIDFLDEQQSVGRFLWPRDGITLHTSNTQGRETMRRAMNSVRQRHPEIDVRESYVDTPVGTHQPHFTVSAAERVD